MDLISILDNIGGFFGGACSGGILATLATWAATRKEAEASAMEKVQDIYAKLTGDLVTEIERLKTEVELLRKEVNTLTHRAGMACFRPFCISRMYEAETNQLYQIERNEDIETDHPTGL